jgi:hypothetical protein
MKLAPIPGKDPGPKKNDGYSKQISPEKIVNEQDQEKVSNGQPATQSKEPAEEVSKPGVLEYLDAELSDKATEESEHVTQETLEEDRKHRSGINA